MTDKLAKRHVNVALRRMKAVWEQTVLPGSESQPAPGSTHSEGFLATELADLVIGMPGSRPGPNEKTPSKTSKKKQTRRSASLDIVGNRIQPKDGALVALVQFQLDGSLDGMTVEATAGIGYDGGTDRSSAGAIAIRGFAPGHLNKVDSWPEETRSSSRLQVRLDDPKDWTLVVEFPEDHSVDIDLRLISTGVAA